MPILQVRDVPEDLYETLSRVAREDNRSISQETIVLLRTALNLKQERVLRRKVVMENMEEVDIDSSDWPDPVDLIREDRDR